MGAPINVMNLQDPRTAVEQFRDAMCAAGVAPPDAIVDDGELHRFSTNGKRSDTAGCYVLHRDGIPAGWFKDWRIGLEQTWCAETGRKLTAAENAANKARVKAMLRAKKLDEDQRRAEAATEAKAIWEASPAAPDTHPYLVKKGIQANGARLHENRLVLPVHDGKQFRSLQFIRSDGEKKFLPGGRVKGSCCVLGEIQDPTVLCIAEGFATGATIYEVTGYPVAVAFDAGNLEPAARNLRDLHPDVQIIICADDDAATKGNPGITQATAAARAVGAKLAVPDFGANRADGATDFNDMAKHCGADAVRNAIVGLVDQDDQTPPTTESGSDLAKSDVTAVTDVQPNNGAGLGVTSAVSSDVTDVTGAADAAIKIAEAGPTALVEGVEPAAGGAPDPEPDANEAETLIPGAEDRPKFSVFDDYVQLPDGGKLQPGVWFFGLKAAKDGNSPEFTQQWICSPLHVEAVTVDGQDNNYGRLLRFKNARKRWREWAMPMAMLAGDGVLMREALLSMGVAIDPRAKNLLTQYLQAITPKRQMHCAIQVGWCKDSFVLPDSVIGPNGAGVIFQSGESEHNEHTVGGTIDGWRSGIARRAVGNPLLMLALSASFAGPILQRCGGESGGIHFVGNSSTGKTTLLEAACATWGGEKFKRTWRATSNGMEGAAALFNDCLLALDEISECDPDEIGAIVYALGNGRGKQRANRTGTARSVVSWRCCVISTGERTIGTAMAEGHHRAKAGQAVRLLDIPADGQFGAFDDLHGLPSGAAFSDAIKEAARAHHGHAGRAFLEKLTRENRDIRERLEQIKALPELSVEGAEGQDKRVAGRFAQMALAGELATEYGITGWAEGAATAAAVEGFKAWRTTRGRGNDERRQIIEKLSAFIDLHGDSRFSNADGSGHQEIRDRAGWWQDDWQNLRSYLFNAGGLRDALKGFDFNRALDVLVEAGVLPKPAANGERSTPQRIGKRTVRVYQVAADKLTVDGVT